MKAYLKIAGVFLVSLFTLTSCKLFDEDANGMGDSMHNFWIGYATVNLKSDHPINGQPDFDLTLDDGTLLLIVANHVYFPEGSKLKDGTRVLINFTKLKDAGTTEDGERMQYIQLNGMREILLKKPVYSSQVEDMFIGNDPIDLDEVWFGGKYLNALFLMKFNNPNTKHFVNLLVNEEHSDADEENIYVEFRHNAYGDGQSKKGYGRVSFDIEEFIPEGKNSVTVHWTYTNYRGQVVTDSGKFSRKNTQSGGEKTLTTEESLDNIY